MGCFETLLCNALEGLDFLLLNSLYCLLGVAEGKLCWCCVNLAEVVICVCKQFRGLCGVVGDLE